MFYIHFSLIILPELLLEFSLRKLQELSWKYKFLFLLQPEKLNVHKNDSESWDYTISLGESLNRFLYLWIYWFSPLLDSSRDCFLNWILEDKIFMLFSICGITLSFIYLCYNLQLGRTYSVKYKIALKSLLIYLFETNTMKQ